MNNRKLRSSVIRARFGVQGVREDRRLRVELGESTRRWRHLTALHAALLGKKGVKAGWQRRKLAVAIWRNARNHAQLALRVAALVDPKYDAALRASVQSKWLPWVWRWMKVQQRIARLATFYRRTHRDVRRAPKRLEVAA